MIVSMIIMVGCTSVDNKFSRANFKDEMLERGHEYKIVDENSMDNLLGEKCDSITLDDNIIVDGKQYILYDIYLYIYSYENNGEMENAASKVNEDASVITFSELPMEIEWYKTPHFYKKGTIIVRYEGNDEKIINDLKEIMGEQFAGK